MRINGMIDMPSGGSQAVANRQRQSLEVLAMIESSRIHRPSHARRLLAVLTLLLCGAAEGAEVAAAVVQQVNGMFGSSIHTAIYTMRGISSAA